ncbi:MAG: ABC transporter ATP-binding protein [Eubacteriales bacterium]|nr:ABC transporter ATP-binding protein [Eubacteriales bacterium]
MAPPANRLRTARDFIRFYFGPELWRLALWTVIKTAVSFSVIGFSFYVSHLLNRLNDGRLTKESVLIFVGAMLLIELVLYLVSLWVQVGAARCIVSRRAFVQRQLLKHAVSMRQPYFRQFSEGDLMNRILKEIQGVQSRFFMFSVKGLDAAFLGLALLAVIAKRFQPSFAAIALCILLLGVLPLNALAKKSSDVFSSLIQKESRYTEFTRESLENIRELRSYGASSLPISRQKELSRALEKDENKRARYNAPGRYLSQFTVYLAMLVLLFLTRDLSAEGKLKVGDFYLLFQLVGLLFGPVVILGEFPGFFKQLRVTAQRIAEILEADDGLSYTGERLKSIDQLYFKNYSFSYPESEEAALKSVSLELKPNEFVCLVGPVASGKSTLLRQPLLLEALGSGSFEIQGIPAEKLSADGTDGALSFIGQEITLFAGTLRENLCLGLEKVSDEALHAALKQAAFTFPDTMPEGLDTLVGQRGLTLSGGQKKRLALARAYLSPAKLWLFDDVLSAVDASTEAQILEGFKKELGRRSILMATHRLSAARLADRIYVLVDGRIEAVGSFDELAAESPAFQALLQADQQKEVRHA